MFPVVDMHCDTISSILNRDMDVEAGKESEGICLRKNEMHIDLERMKAGGYMCQCFALFTFLKKPQVAEGGAFNYLLRMNEVWDREISANSDLIRPAVSVKNIEENFRGGFISAVKTVEEGGVFEGKIENLKAMYDRGMRMATLTWNFENELAFPNNVVWEDVDGNMHSGMNEPIPGFHDPSVRNLRFVPDKERGLKPCGRDFVKAMEEMGIVIDVSHLNDAGIADILNLVRRDTPVIASHSNARAVTGHARNLTDEFLKNIAAHGGVCGINFAADFLNSRGDNKALISDMTAHMKHMKKVAGVDVIGLGSDHDGISNELESGGCDGMQLIADAMSKEGFSDEEIEKVFHKNVLRVFGDVWK